MDRFVAFVCVIFLLPLPASQVRAQPASESPQVIPTRYEGGLLYAVPVTTHGDTLLFLTDTGGGTNLSEKTARRYDLPLFYTGYQAAGDSIFRAPLPLFQEGASIPPPLVEEGRLSVFNPQKLLPDEVIERVGMDRWTGGQLGFKWFAGRTWTFDYENGRLLMHAPMAPLPETGRRAPLRFKTDQRGRRTGRLPVLDIVVAGDTLAMAFDTGAAGMPLKPHAVEALSLEPGTRHASSFLRASIFERWREEHPDWQIIDEAKDRPDVSGMNADPDNNKVIVVPRVKIADLAVGPVYFEVATDESADRIGKDSGAERVAGAIGGSVLRHFDRITVSYPRAVAIFEK